MDTEMRDCRALPADCLAAIISRTSPLDACRWSVVSRFFNSVAKSKAVWVKFLPTDYLNLVPASRSAFPLKDLYLSLCDHPVLIEDGKKSFSLDKRSGKKCYMLAPRNLAITWGDTPHYWRAWISTPDSRFPEVARLLLVCWFEITGRIDCCNLSPMTRYNAFLVFKQLAHGIEFQSKPMEATVRIGGTQVSKRNVYVIDSGDVVQNGEQYPKVRGDGWFEVELGEFFNGRELEELEIHIFSFDGYSAGVLHVQGIDIRPC